MLCVESWGVLFLFCFHIELRFMSILIYVILKLWSLDFSLLSFAMCSCLFEFSRPNLNGLFGRQSGTTP